ncbi:MAG: hypothetical protein ACM3SV_13230, partial [Betaproteobacteria bacterium]
MRQTLLFAAMLFLLVGCDQVNQTLGLEDTAKKEARQEAEGRAVGGGCRQSGRAIEDCYAIYSWLPKSAVFAGWRDMDAYMRENKIETIEPQLPPAEPPGARKRRQAAGDDEEVKPVARPKAEKPASKPAEQVSEKPAEKTAEKPA